MDNIDSLIADLHNSDRLVRNNAVWSLTKFGEAARRAIPALKLVMEDKSEPFIQIMAAQAISRIAPEDPSPTPVLLAGLKNYSSDGMVRACAIEVLGERRSKTAVLNAMTLLSDEDFLVRFATAKAVGLTFGNWMHATAICVAMLKDENPTYRAMGAECLMSIRRYIGDHLDLLTMAMSDAPWEARIDIEEVLATLKKQ